MTKISGQHCAILFNGYDLSGRSRQFAANMEWTEEDATAFLDGAVNSQAGLANFEANITVYLDPDATSGYVQQSWEALKSPGGLPDKVLMFLFGQGATPDESDPAITSLIKQFTANAPETPTEKIMLEAKFKSVGYEPQTGYVGAYETITNTLTSDTIDLGAAISAGLNAYLIIFLGASEDSPGTDTYSIKIQHNTVDNGSWADYLTFSADGSIRAGERQTSSSSVNRYVRVLATRSGAAADSVGIAVVVCPNEWA